MLRSASEQTAPDAGQQKTQSSEGETRQPDYHSAGRTGETSLQLSPKPYKSLSDREATGRTGFSPRKIKKEVFLFVYSIVINYLCDTEKMSRIG